MDGLGARTVIVPEPAGWILVVVALVGSWRVICSVAVSGTVVDWRLLLRTRIFKVRKLSKAGKQIGNLC